MLLVIDNYDSFTYNLVQYFGELGQEIKVFRNDQITLDEIREMDPDHIVKISIGLRGRWLRKPWKDEVIIKHNFMFSLVAGYG